ncbi:WSC domain-containing protein 2-like [Haliotis rubra]|uniref:WSC domain-containing protein 2-like n=1 Tax=Haliotis rubra TaxID=36100 RepID=UPI001EE50B92|nr:WSC domain-containing protein 2-like [Haliotis rubra]
MIQGASGATYGFLSVRQGYLGCYVDTRENRVLPHSFMIDKTRMTTETCRLHCQRNHHPYFGTEYGTECYCGDVLRLGNRLKPETECSMPCAGDKSTVCGGPLRISVYKVV